MSQSEDDFLARVIAKTGMSVTGVVYQLGYHDVLNPIAIRRLVHLSTEHLDPETANRLARHVTAKLVAQRKPKRSRWVRA